MLQFSPTVYSISTKFTSRLLWRLHTSLLSNAATVSNVHVKGATSSITNDIQPSAFNQLKTKLCADIGTKSLVISRIHDAEDIHDLLQVMKEPLLTQVQIINALNTITSWVNENNRGSGTAPTDNSVQSNQSMKIREQNVTGKSDLSKYQDLSTTGLIQEVKKLAREGKRDVQVLNYIYHNIVLYSKMLPPLVCSSLMFDISRIGYADERLLKKIYTDLLWYLTNQSPKVAASIIVSLLKSAAIMRYRNDTVFLHTANDIIKSQQQNKYNNNQVASILMSFAVLGYHSETVDKVIEVYKRKWSCHTLGHNEWLDVVWSLCILERVDESQISSVLNAEFIKKLMLYDVKKRLSYQLKLLNIDSYARCVLENYNEPPVAPTFIPCTLPKQSNQKKLYIEALEETLKKLVPSVDHYKMSIDTQMGFSMDAELHVDCNMTVVIPEENVKEEIFKIGIVLLDYYDMCLGSKHELGLIKLYKKLLTTKNYRVVVVPYLNFSIGDKVEKRLSYLKRQIWATLNDSF